MTDSTVYDDTYFLTGKQSGKSLYENYRYLAELTPGMCRRIINVLGIDIDDTIADFGCARGYITRAFRELGYKSYGFDVSKWAIDNCDPTIKDYVRLIEGDSFARMTKKFDWVIAKDVLEHIPNPELEETITQLLRHARKGLFVVVPLSPAEGEPYVVPEYELDITHVQRTTLGGWVSKLHRPGFNVSGRHLLPGVKQNYCQYEEGNGFITVLRNEQL